MRPRSPMERWRFPAAIAISIALAGVALLATRSCSEPTAGSAPAAAPAPADAGRLVDDRPSREDCERLARRVLDAGVAEADVKGATDNCIRDLTRDEVACLLEQSANPGPPDEAALDDCMARKKTGR